MRDLDLLQACSEAIASSVEHKLALQRDLTTSTSVTISIQSAGYNSEPLRPVTGFAITLPGALVLDAVRS